MKKKCTLKRNTLRWKDLGVYQGKYPDYKDVLSITHTKDLSMKFIDFSQGSEGSDWEWNRQDMSVTVPVIYEIGRGMGEE